MAQTTPPTEHHALAAEAQQQRKPSRGELVNYRQDQYSSRRWLTTFLADVMNPENAILRRERSEDGYYRYPYGILDEMLQKDPHLSALVELRKQAVLDCELSIVPADESPEARRITDFCEWVVTQRLGSADGQDWRSATSALLDAVGYGFRVSELIWEVSNWDGRPYWVLDAIKARRHRRFSFGPDDELMLINLGGKAEPVPEDKFVIARLYPADDSPWGDPLLARVYPLWLFKKAVIVYWIAYCEKYGQPLPVGKLNEDFAGSDEELSKFDDMLAGIQQEGFARLGKGQELDVIEFGRGDTKALYEDFIKFVTREMSKLWVGATMILEESDNGTQSMSTVLEGRFLSKVAADARAISRVWTSILHQVVTVNFGSDVAENMTPTVTLTVTEQKDLEKEANVVKVLMEAGLPLSKKDLYTTFGRHRPKDDDSDDLLKKADQQPQLSVLPGATPPVAKDMAQRKSFDEALVLMLAAGVIPAPGLLDTLDKIPVEMAVQFMEDQAAKHTHSHAEATASFDTTAIAAEADADRERVMEDKQLLDAVREGVDDMLAQLRERMSQADSLRDLLSTWANNTPGAGVDPAKLSSALTNLYKLSWLRGALKNAANLGFVGMKDERQFGEPNPVLFADLKGYYSTFINEDGNLFAETKFDSLKFAIERVSKLNILTRPEFDTLDSWSRSLAFTAAAQTSDTLSEGLRTLVLDSIEQGLSLTEAIEKVRPYWDPLPSAAAGDTVFVTEAHIENVVRTNTMRAYNQGWNDIAYSDGMAARFPAARYVSVIDSRTTPTCRSLDGRILTRDTVEYATPPLHYQCRGVLVWLTVGQMDSEPASAVLTREGLGQLPDKAQPMPGFGRYVPLFGGRAA